MLPTATIQQVATWPVALGCKGGKVSPRLMVKVATALGPASATARCPVASKSTANGTAPGRVGTVGLADGPSRPTRKMSMLLAPFFVVTTRREPSGEKAMSLGVLRRIPESVRGRGRAAGATAGWGSAGRRPGDIPGSSRRRGR